MSHLQRLVHVIIVQVRVAFWQQVIVTQLYQRCMRVNLFSSAALFSHVCTVFGFVRYSLHVREIAWWSSAAILQLH